MFLTDVIGIIADDLTGANDTALQFFMKGSNTEIVLGRDALIENHLNVSTWALSTESRNIPADSAARIVYESCGALKERFNVEHFYKKIDSTLRGNIAVETLAALEATGKEAAIIAPAFVQEGRITIGGYQLLKGVPIERTDAARDAHAPIYESYIPDILKHQLDENKHKLIGSIEMNIVAKGAGPIVLQINNLIKEGKKLIVMDSVSTVDFEQIVLAIKKSSHDILPVGSAGLAHAMGNIWLGDMVPLIPKKIPDLPKLILSGSATSISALQLEKLHSDDDIENTYFIPLHLKDIFNGLTEAMILRVTQNLGKNNIVAVHSSDLMKEITESEASELLIDEGITKTEFASKITEYLAKLAKEVKKRSEFILITVGGETSFNCCSALNCDYLQVVDAILPSIPLCMDANAQFVVTKSGNLGTSSTLVDIIKYFENHKDA